MSAPNNYYYELTFVDPLTPNSKKIEIYQAQLQHCQSSLKQLKHAFSTSFDRIQNYKYEKELTMLQKKKEFLKQKLSSLGVNPEKRGRPSKPTETRYDYSRAKFTAKLLKENLLYLQTLKNQGAISSISAFLDELIENHHKKMSFTKQIPLESSL